MKQTATTLSKESLPASLRPYLTGRVFDSSSSPEASVWFFPDAGLYLKRAERGMLKKEAEMTSFFYRLGLSVEVCAYLSEEEDWLLTAAADGADATDACYLADGRRLAATIGEALRALHETVADACPVPDRTGDYLRTVEENAARGCFDPSFLPAGLSLSREEALATVRDAAPALSSRVLLHGDYCLPNILLKEWRVTRFIDLGGGGIGDRHIDLFWGAWTLCFNLGTDRYRDDFLSAYGRELVDPALLRAVAAAECFG